MLETKDLCKIYKPKKGVSVTALNKISLKFPETGMVFLLGKSGSGKSTMLNVLGGLDKYDSGEIIIKGVSSKNFNQQHFDSYRNTYVGFIFQEYNVLDEFTVGANIALAIELQGKKATNQQIADILKEVDLEGFGDRKPNELSGGQKQRVAIARALVKQPEIIMADEPTGALDSNTGKQVFDTLKKLSLSKLVIVVSHDRDFAELYADRIIELADGNVISDVEIDNDADNKKDVDLADQLKFNGNTVEINQGYHLTDDDRKAINEYIDKISKGNLNITVKNDSANAKKFVNTNEDNIVYKNSNKFNLIKSKLPLKNAFKIGGSGLKYKKVRLVFTIILSCVAFGLFGLADTFAAYNHVNTCTKSIMDTGVSYTSVQKSQKFGSGVNAYWKSGYKISGNDLDNFEKQTGVKMTGIFNPLNSDMSFASNINSEVALSKSDYQLYSKSFTGYTEINQEILKNMNMKLAAGSLPDGSKNEIAISNLIFETFKVAGYFDGNTFEKDKNGIEKPVYQKIQNYSDMIGKLVKFNNINYTISGIIDTNIGIDRYDTIIEDHSKDTKSQKLITYALAQEYRSIADYSIVCTAMVGKEHLNNLIDKSPKISSIMNGWLYYQNDQISIDPSFMARLNDVTASQKIVWLDGEKDALTDKEIIVTSDLINNESEDEQNGENLQYEELIGDNNFHIWGYDSDYKETTSKDIKVVGIIPISNSNSGYSRTVVTDNATFDKYTSGNSGDFTMAVGTMPKEKQDVKTLVSYCYNEDTNMRYELMNSVTFELDSINDILKVLSKVFMYIGLGFALFAALMLANFIGTSISHKKQEIGILRAIGSRSNDVFRIFFAESFIIAMVNFVLSSIGVFVATIVINYFIRSRAGILVTVLNFSLRQVLLLLAVSIIVAVVASFLPVKRIASKRPIDAIRDR